MVCCTYFNIKSSWVLLFWTFNLRSEILATVLAIFPNIGRIFVQFSGHSAPNPSQKYKTRIEMFARVKRSFLLYQITNCAVNVYVALNTDQFPKKNERKI
jgi:hypothetical protein